MLNHVEPGLAKAYDRHSYDKERQEALNAWGAQLSRTVRDLEIVRAGGGEEQVRVCARPQL